MRGATAKRINTTMKNAEATNTTETAAVAEQGAQVAPEKAAKVKEAKVPREFSKKAIVLDLLRRPKGATMAEIAKATD